MRPGPSVHYRTFPAEQRWLCQPCQSCQQCQQCQCQQCRPQVISGSATHTRRPPADRKRAVPGPLLSAPADSGGRVLRECRPAPAAPAAGRRRGGGEGGRRHRRRRLRRRRDAQGGLFVGTYSFCVWIATVAADVNRVTDTCVERKCHGPCLA